jgi:hypothetical protein
MFKRLFWLMIGMALGIGATFWAMRLVRNTIGRLRPERLSSDLAAAMRGLRKDVRAAVEEGRAAMREREIELREELARH